MGWFIQTAIFVIFNKVCTSQVRAAFYLFVTWIDEYDVDVRIQYFLWYILFLPLIIPRLSLSWLSSVKYLVCWMGTQALLLSQAYRVEFLGEPIFFRLWICCIIYVVGHSWVLERIVNSYQV
jgi:phosphatidylinositol glycan class M